MKLNASIACAGLLASLMAGGMPQAVAGSIGIDNRNLSAIGAPFAVENLSSLPSTGVTIDSNGYKVTVGNISGSSLVSGNTFDNASGNYILMSGSQGVPAFTLTYSANNRKFSSTIFNFLWKAPQSSSASLTFNTLVAPFEKQTVFASRFKNSGVPEWVSIHNLKPFNTVKVVGFVGETDDFVPGVLVPEPSSLCILGSGLLVLGFIQRARRRRDRSSPMSGDLSPTTSDTQRLANDKLDSVLVD